MRDRVRTTKTATVARASKAAATRELQTQKSGDTGRWDGDASGALTALVRLLARQSACEALGSEADRFEAAKLISSKGGGESRLSTSDTRARKHGHETE